MTATATKLAGELTVGDMVDLEGDKFATMPAPDADERILADHKSTVSMFQYEYAEVDSTVRETEGCIVVHTSLASFGCPPDHPLKLAPEDAQRPWRVGLTRDPETGQPKPLGHFGSHDEAAEFIGTLDGHEDGRYYIDGPTTDQEG